jgi:uncharacterized Zn-finger protein
MLLVNSTELQADNYCSPYVKRKRLADYPTPETGSYPSSSCSKTLSESLESEYSRCYLCNFRPTGEQRWYKRVMTRHMRTRHPRDQKIHLRKDIKGDSYFTHSGKFSPVQLSEGRPFARQDRLLSSDSDDTFPTFSPFHPSNVPPLEDNLDSYMHDVTRDRQNIPRDPSMNLIPLNFSELLQRRMENGESVGRPESTNSNECTLPHECAECGARFPDYAALDRHAHETGDLIYKCCHSGCDSRYNRRDTFLRHLGTHANTARFECPYCQKHNDPKAFKRKDHLRQHIRYFHNVSLATMNADIAFCPHHSCPSSSYYAASHGGQRAFETRKDYEEHMRKVHGQSTYECDVSGCERVGPKGYARESDLTKHKRTKHGITDSGSLFL